MMCQLFGVDSIKAGNAVQLIMVLGLTVGWISTYVFRVSSKEMTYAKQLKDYENKVMEVWNSSRCLSLSFNDLQDEYFLSSKATISVFRPFPSRLDTIP